MPRNTKSIARHIEGLKAYGPSTTMHLLTGRVDIQRICRSFNMFVKRKHPGVGEYHHMWFATPDGIVLCYAGNSFLMEAVKQFVVKLVSLDMASTSTEIYTGRSKKAFMVELEFHLSQYSPLRSTRSFGGTHGKATK
jgi:hypothetical protein